MFNPSPFSRGRLRDIPITTAGDAIAVVAHMNGYLPPAGMIAVIFTRNRTVVAVIQHMADLHLDEALLAQVAAGPGDGVIVVGVGTPAEVAREVADVARAAAVQLPVIQRVCGTADRHWVLGAEGDPHDPAGLTQPIEETAYSRAARSRGSVAYRNLDGLRRWLESVSGAELAQIQTAATAAAHMADLMMRSGLGETAEMITYMRLAIDAAATACMTGDGMTTADAAAVCAFLDDRRMSELLDAFARFPDHDTVLSVCADLTRLAPARHRTSAATHLGLAALAHSDSFLAEEAVTLAVEAIDLTEDADPAWRRIGYLRMLLYAEPVERPGLDADALDDTEKVLRSQVTAVFRTSEVLDLCESTCACSTLRDLPDATGMLARPGEPDPGGTARPALWWRGRDLTSNAGDPVPAVLQPVEVAGPAEGFDDAMFPADIVIDAEMLDFLRRSAADGKPCVRFRRAEMGATLEAESVSRHSN